MKITLNLKDFKVDSIDQLNQLDKVVGGENCTTYAAGCTDGDVGCCDADEPSDYGPCGSSVSSSGHVQRR